MKQYYLFNCNEGFLHCTRDLKKLYWCNHINEINCSIISGAGIEYLIKKRNILGYYEQYNEYLNNVYHFSLLWYDDVDYIWAVPINFSTNEPNFIKAVKL